MPNRIWVDVEDLFQYAVFNNRPSGIQRIEFELCRALALMPETRDRVGFLRHAAAQGSFDAIPFADVDALHARLTSAVVRASKPTLPDDAVSAGGRPRGLGRRIAYRVPLEVRGPLIALGKAQAESLRAAGRLAGASLGWLGRMRTRSRQPLPADTVGHRAGDGLTVAPFAGTVEPGDVLLVLGSTWFHPFYGEMVARARALWQLRIAVLVYDVIPLLRPEWCQQNLVERFEIWARSLLPQADILLTISHASAQDLVRLADRAGFALQGLPVPIAIGTGFSRATNAGATARTDRLLPPRTYVLMVSTIEARKNHALLFRVWRRLLDEMPAERVPTLVFAGKVGWLVGDLMEQLRNARHLDGKVVVIEDPQDGELERLYQDCLFTVFPSFYEGWGLPVTESFSFGRPCIISNASALPEAGGTLARYFDPENGGEAFQVIRHALDNPNEIEAWGARIAAEFRPVAWDESARQVLRTLDRGRLPPPSTPGGMASDSGPGPASDPTKERQQEVSRDRGVRRG